MPSSVPLGIRIFTISAIVLFLIVVIVIGIGIVHFNWFSNIRSNILIKSHFSGGKSGSLYGTDKSSGVRELSSADFESAGFEYYPKDYLGKSGMIVFYAPWCGHCQSMVKEVNLVSDSLNTARNYIVAVNCDKNPELANKFSVHSFPTIKLISPSGQVSDYTGGRDSVSMLAVLR